MLALQLMLAGILTATVGMALRAFYWAQSPSMHRADRRALSIWLRDQRGRRLSQFLSFPLMAAGAGLLAAGLGAAAAILSGAAP